MQLVPKLKVGSSDGQVLFSRIVTEVAVETARDNCAGPASLGDAAHVALLRCKILDRNFQVFDE